MTLEALTLNKYQEYWEEVSRAYARSYQEFINTYFAFPLTLIKTGATTTSTTTSDLSSQRNERQFFGTAIKGGFENSPNPMYFEDFQVGATFSSEETMVSRQDIQNFADLTGDWNKLHVDDAYAKSVGFSSVIAHGMLNLSVALGLWYSLALTNSTTLALAGFNSVAFKAPVYPGDVLRLDVQVLSTRASKSKPNAGLVTLKWKMFNDKGTLVVEAEPVLVIQKKLFLQ